MNEGNVILSVTPAGQTAQSEYIEQTLVSDEWLDIGGAKYALTTVEDSKENVEDRAISLPMVSFTANAGDTKTVYWQAKSLLRLNVGPSTPQTLHINSQTIEQEPGAGSNTYYTRDDLDFYYVDESKTTDNEELIFTTTNKAYYTADNPLSFKTNKLIQSANIEIPTVYIEVDSENRAIDYTTDLKVKFFKQVKDLYTNDATNGINISAFGNSFTRLTYNYTPDTVSSKLPPHLDLNILLPENHFGLVMFYNNKVNNESGVTKNTFLAFNKGNLDIYNKPSWWNANDDDIVNPYKIGQKTNKANGSDIDKYFLRKGINIVRINTSGILSIYAGEPENDVVIFSDLDVIPSADGGINPNIDYQLVGTNISDDILGKIKKLDPSYEFYYNNIPSNDLIIDLNNTKLSDPRNYYDKNNINNKFVISEINSDAMIDGIKIAESSKR